MGTLARNPVLRGFMPDPTVVRVGDEYLLANSSFEWFPAIPLHRSTDLVEWEYVGSLPAESLELRGVADSGGVWAPSLSYDGTTIWLVFGVIITNEGGEKDVRTYVSRSAAIGAGWSAPIRVPSTGFDPALFHEQGRVWLVNMRWDSRPGRESFAGITLQELDAEILAPLEEPRVILTHEALIEGPGLERRDDRYWLSVVEGGTGWNHGITMYRSRTLHGPYERDPLGSYLTTRNSPAHWAQKAGHGEIVDAPGGGRVLVHLGSRVVRRGDTRFGALGRETFVERVVHDPDGWPRLAGGSTEPAEYVEIPHSESGFGPSVGTPAHRASDLPSWPWSSLRRPVSAAWVRPADGGWSIRGGDSLHSLFEQSLLAQRIRELPTLVSVDVLADPRRTTDAAGLVVWYDTQTYSALLIGMDDDGERILVLRERVDGGPPRDTATRRIPTGTIRLRAGIDDTAGVCFSWAAGGLWEAIGEPIDVTRFSDDFGSRLRFTGPMWGLTVIDTLDASWWVNFQDIRVRASVQ